MRIHHDLLGEVVLKDEPRRVVSLAPHATDSLFALGLGGLLVGRSAFCHRPAQALSLPVLGSYTRAREELLAELAPDLVLLGTGVQRGLALSLKEKGFPVFVLPLPSSPFGILENLELLAGLLGVPERATPLVQFLSKRYLALANRFRLRVYLEIDLGGPVTVGRGSYIAAALRHMGLHPVFGDVPQAYFTPDLAEVEGRAPDLFIYEPKPWRSRPQEAARRLMEERGWRLPLVVTDGDELAHFGPMFFGFLEKLAERVARTLGEA
ncbi:ABC transporter substrate-binding protein [Thermus filiformis]|uniref:Iron ABC transporter substrate-binding protein n=1 Tax=Thermus filiformis TaxID=276 RepID=A0A0A2WP54_THEFI|nr:helical backbone metal receptor [Thermus filiformis]KGQ21578.1 iron ABC transporter substrate-binding protein [Thermus filiformis]